MSTSSIETVVTNLTTTSVTRIMRAVWATPGRWASQATNDAKAAELVAQADADWVPWHTARYGEEPSAEQRKYRKIASRVGWGFPLLFLGKPGTAKTSIGEGVAIGCGMGANSIIGSQQQPEEVGGYPVPNADHTSITKLPAPWVDMVCGGVNGFVQIFDELTTADEDMEAAMLRVFSDRAAGERSITGRVRLVAFGNRVGEVAKARDLTPASANRFAHIHWDGPTTVEWNTWVSTRMDADLISMIGDDDGEADPAVPPDPNVEEMRVLKAWPAALARAKAIMTTFMGNGGGSLHDMPDPSDPQQSSGWPSHRSNEQAIRALACATVHSLSDVETIALLTGLVGSGQAVQLVQFMTKDDLPDPMSVLDGKPWVSGLTGETHAAWGPDHRLDVSMIVMAETSATLLANPLSKVPKKDEKMWRARGDRWWSVAKSVADVGHGDALFVPGRLVLMNSGYDINVCPAARLVTREMLGMINAVSAAKR